MAMVLLWTVLWISGYGYRLSAEMSVQYKYFLSGKGEGVSLQVPAETNGKEFVWEWRSHDGRHTNARIITIIKSKFSWNLLKLVISKQRKYDIVLQPEFQNAGVFTFIQTKPEKVNVAKFEVFAVKVEPSHWSPVYKGSDVIRSCEVSHLPDSATLDWERDGEPIANTTLIYNNTAHIIIHSADQYSEGTYNCTLRWNGTLIFSIPRTLQVYTGTYGTPYTLYRGSLNSSEVVLMCDHLGSYTKASWEWEPLSRTNVIIMASADKYDNPSISMEIDRERFSSEAFDRYNFHLRISPVKFGDSGRYFCYCDADSDSVATITLVTVQVSAVPPGGLSRSQSVVLNCEISQVIGNVTLAWLQMKGGWGKLVKQEVLSEGQPKMMLSLTLPIVSRDQLHWACAVFTESMLRAQVPLHLTLPTPITEPEEPTTIIEPEEPKPDNGRMLMIGLACAAAVCVGVLLLLGGLLFRRLKTAASVSTSPAEGNGAADAVYSNVTDLQQGQVDENDDSSAAVAVYSEITKVAKLQKDQEPVDENDDSSTAGAVYSEIKKVAELQKDQGVSTSPAEGSGAADAVYSNVTDLQQGQVDENDDSSAAVAVYSEIKKVAKLQKDQVDENGDSSAAVAVYSEIKKVAKLQKDQVDAIDDSSAADAVYSEIKKVAELQKDQGNQDTPKEENDNSHRQQRRQLNPQSRSELEENDKAVYASVCKR